MISILVTHLKGGCGKTTIAINLAAGFTTGGLCTALADADRQRGALEWLAQRPPEAPAITGLDWRKDAGHVPAGVQRLIIDAPANLKMRHVEDLLVEADVVVV